MNRLSLSHKPAVFGFLLSAFTNRAITPDISFAEFQSMTEEFKTACEKAFGTACTITLTFMDRPKSVVRFYSEVAMQTLDERNKAATFATLASLDQATSAQWDKAAYVEVSIIPVDADKAPASSAGQIEFKGNTPQGVTYHIQGPDDEVCTTALRTVRAAHLNMEGGDGSNGNSERYIIGMPLPAAPAFAG